MKPESAPKPVKTVVKAIISIPVYGLWLFYKLRVIWFPTVSCLLALVPGLVGVFWRASWYRLTLESCGDELYVDWLGAIRTPKARLGRNVFIGTGCWLGWVEIGDDVMLGGHITVLSGGQQHNFDRLDVPMRQQGGELARVRIGNDVWVGNRSVIMADVAEGTVIGAGAVVNKSFEPYSIIAGVPARLIRKRGQTTA